MLARFLTGATCTLLFASTATAQRSPTQPSPITTPVKDAGVYHMATGTWSRGAQAAALAGPEIIYDNTCEVGYYWGLLEGDRMIDSGRLPSTSSPSSPTSLPGLYDVYEVNGFTVGYCSFEPLVTSFDLSFINCYTACDGGGVFPQPIITYNVINVPAGTAAGGQGCWMLTFDLSNFGSRFDVRADCDETYNNVASTDSFGWAWMQTVPTTGSNSGPIFAGDPQNHFPNSAGIACAGLGGGTIGGGTTFVGAGAGPGSGIGSTDQVEVVDGPTTPGCYWFGGYDTVTPLNPMSSFYLRLEGKLGFIPPPPPVCQSACLGDGSAGVCPCGNFGATGAGCANSSLGGATLYCMGEPSHANDTLELHITGVNGAKPGLLIRGNHAAGSGSGVVPPGSAGLLCAVGGSQRSHVQVTDASGSTIYMDWNGSGLGSVANAAGVPTYYQFWYRDAMGSPCTGTDFNFTGSVRVTYLP